METPQTGFSLIELLVVMGILALSLTLVPPMLGNAIDSSEIRNTARTLAAGLRYGRSQAVTSRNETAFTIDVQNRKFSVADRQKTLELPDQARIKLITAESEKLSEHEGAVRFFPDGSSTGGQIILAWKESEYNIDINWLTGGITISP